jgi:hypothetical protein
MRFPVGLLALGCLVSMAGAQSSDVASQVLVVTTPARLALEQMSPAERKNSSISVEFGTSNGEAVALERDVERLWNGGQYDEALALLGELEARVGRVAIGNSWRKPVPTRETSLWGSDIRIGNRDSLLGLVFDSGRMTGGLFVVLRHGHGPAYYSVCMSADGGATWVETFTWVGSPATCLDAGVLYQHFYVAYYSPGENVQQVRLRQFRCSDGSADEFRNGDMWVAACTLDVGDTAREVSYASASGGGGTWQFIATLVSDGSVLLSQDDMDAVSWATRSTGITSGASRGLDATYNLGGSGSTWFLLSYLDATDTLRIYGGTSTGFTQRRASFCGTSELTCISAYYDAVVCAYEDESSSPQRVRYACSLDGGDTWTTGTLSDTSIAAEAPAVTVAYGGRFGAVFRHCTPTSELRFCQRTGIGPWSGQVSIADNEPYWSRPGIEPLYVGTYEFAVAYVSNTSPVERGAFFDRSDWPYGLADERRTFVDEGDLRVTPNPLKGHGRLYYALDHPAYLQVEVYDRAGRVVRTLFDGVSPAGRQSFGFDAGGMTPGVYFIRADADGRALTVPVTVVK